MYTEAIIFKLGHREGLTLRGEEIVEWPYEQPIPSKDELDLWVSEHQAATQYIVLRAKSYDSIKDQLDALWHDIDTDQLNKAGNFYRRIKRIKDLFPKPTS